MTRHRLGLAGIAVLLAAFGAAPAQASDGAAANVLGFSPDGRHFAFEQYGIRDGSGEAYAIISAIEVATDRPVTGSPATAAINPETAKRAEEPKDKLLDEVRAKAAAQAKPMLDKLKISVPAQRIAALPESRSSDMLAANDIRGVLDEASGVLPLTEDLFGPVAILNLREADFAVPRCKDFVVNNKTKGINLVLQRKGRPPVNLANDRAIPNSRGCPTRYGIAEAHALKAKDGVALAVLIQYFYQAFEGPDRRFIAVTAKIK